MTPMHSTPLIHGFCVDKASRYEVFAVIPAFGNQVNLIGILSQSTPENDIAFTWICNEVNGKLQMNKTAIAIPPADLAALSTGVKEENQARLAEAIALAKEFQKRVCSGFCEHFPIEESASPEHCDLCLDFEQSIKELEEQG